LELRPAPESADTALEDDRKRMLLEKAHRFLEVPARRSLAGGYRRADVDQLLARAARTIDDYARKVGDLQGRLDVLASMHAELEERFRQTRARSPQEAAGEMLTVAQRAIEKVKEDARHEAEQVVADARDEAERIVEEARGRAELVLTEAEHRREESERLRHEAQATIAGARHEAQTLHAVVQTEKDRLLAEAADEVGNARAGLEAEKATLEQAIADLRREWESFIRDALTRLELIEPETDIAVQASETASPAREQSPDQQEAEAEPAREDVASELHARLPSAQPTPTPNSFPGNWPRPTQ
jgi:cell division septum initiation protein DivIVA